MPVRQKFAAFSDDIGEYVIALLRHWRPIVSGAALGLFSWAYGLRTGRNIPASIYLGLLVGAAIVAGFLAWHDEYRRGAGDRQPTGKQDELTILAGQLRHFQKGRSATHEAEFGDAYSVQNQMLDMVDVAIGEPGKRLRKLQALDANYDAHTLQQYGSQFAKRVLSASHSLRAAGVDPTVTDRLATYPNTVADINGIIDALEIASAKIREGSSSSDFAALHKANTNLQNTVAQQRDQIEQQEKEINQLRGDIDRSRPRHLTDLQKEKIAAVLADEKAKFIATFPANDRPEPNDDAFKVLVISIGNDAETLGYRADFVAAIDAGGFETSTDEWSAGPPQYEDYLDILTVVSPTDPRNLIRPIFIQALRAADVPFREASMPIPGRPLRNTATLVTFSFGPPVRLIVGHRR